MIRAAHAAAVLALLLWPVTASGGSGDENEALYGPRTIFKVSGYPEIGRAAWREPGDAPDPSPERLPPAGPRTFTPRQYLYHVAGDQAAILDRLILCESGWKMVPNASGAPSAFGYAQFLDGTWRWTRTAMGLDPDLRFRADPYAHIDATVFLWNRGRGAGHWEESRHCWQ